MKKNILAALLCTAATMAGAPASSEGIYLNSLLDTYEFHDIDPDFWTHQGQRAETIVESGEYLGSRAAEALHNKLGIGEATPESRGLFLAAAGLANWQFQQANAIVFGHEYLHFQYRDYFGYPDHYYLSDDGEEVDKGEGYLSALFTGHVGGTAFNVGPGNGKDPEKVILVKSAGLNWQMNYSEDWVRRNLRSGGNPLFSFPGYLYNRTKMFGYAMADDGGDPGSLEGDVEYMAHYYRDVMGIDADLDDIRLYSGLALLASPATWNVVSSIGEYITTGNLTMADPFFDAGGARFTWDVPTYLNAENMTLAPIAYVEVDGYVFGAGVELPVVGDGHHEYTMTAGRKWDHVSFQAEHSFAPDGGHTELQLGYDYNDHLGLELRHVQSSGESYRADRNNLYGEAVTIAGVNLRF